ncbi:hypothetical protein NC651_031650 [Populus alba x Populus x berolinensis]|nr:hypothetical protein NC651_031650 [Populus alba x Populus x berolinensis]
MTKKPQREGNRRRERVRNMQLQSLDKIVADLLKGKWDGKYIYARARNCCNKKALGTSDPSCEIDGSGRLLPQESDRRMPTCRGKSAFLPTESTAWIAGFLTFSLVGATH